MPEIRERDFFDQLMDWCIMKPFRHVYYKHREGLLYLFFGGLTVLLAVFVYVILLRGFGIHELISNIVSWIAGVTFSFFTTKKWVFLDRNWQVKYVIRQIFDFYMARLATLLLQEVLIYIFITRMRFNDVGVKIVTEFINIVLNYLVSKFIIFRNGK